MSIKLENNEVVQTITIDLTSFVNAKKMELESIDVVVKDLLDKKARILEDLEKLITGEEV